MRFALILAALLLAGCSAPEPSPGTTTTTLPATSPFVTTTTAVSTSTLPVSTTPPPQRHQEGRFAGCSGEGPVPFANPPMRAQDYDVVLPYGLIVGAHVTPIDHMYFSPLRGSARDAFEVRAIADGVIYEMQPRDVNVDTGQARQREWRMDIAHSCTFTSYFDLLTSLAPDLEKRYNETRGPGAREPWRGIPVKAGQVVGRIGAQTLDFGVYDYNVTLPGFVVPAHYDREPWKVHTVDPFPHFPPAIRDEVLAKALRTVEPRAGKIDHDIDGRLVGNWFAVGTNGYAGVDPSKYWEGHLAIAPDAYLPSHVVFSIGNWSGHAAQWSIKGNALDPANVTPESGLVEIELVMAEMYDAKTGAFGVYGITPGNPIAYREQAQVQGTVLLQMTGPRALKLETFPGKTAAEVSGFTDAARVYER